MTRAVQITRRSLLAAPALLLLPRPLTAQAQLAEVRDAAAGLENIHALIVEQGGRRLIGARYRGPDLNRAVNVKSASKTLVATLLGIAIDRGEIAGPEAPLGQVAPQLIPAGADPRVAEITMGDLASLRAGLERTSGPNYGGWVASGNWVADALGREMVAEPGGRMLYSTGSTHVLGAVLAEVSGQSLLALMRGRIGDPLGVEIPPWTRDPQGRYMGGNEMAISPEGLARFGRAVLAGGRYEGRRIVSEGWLKASFVPRGRSQYSGLGYGYGWFLGQAAGRSYALARGYGGQVLAVCPAAEALVVITSDPTKPARSDGYFGVLQEMIERKIFAALA